MSKKILGGPFSITSECLDPDNEYIGLTTLVDSNQRHIITSMQPLCVYDFRNLFPHIGLCEGLHV
jgi:hypothetical protein